MQQLHLEELRKLSCSIDEVKAEVREGVRSLSTQLEEGNADIVCHVVTGIYKLRQDVQTQVSTLAEGQKEHLSALCQQGVAEIKEAVESTEGNLSATLTR